MNELELLEAVKSGDYATAEKLIKMGSDVNQQDQQGWTPLNFAAGKGNLSIVKLLVEHGADIFKVGRDRRAPYMIALAAGQTSVARYLKEVENDLPGEKPARPPSKYCKAYYLKDLRAFSGWNESRINWNEQSIAGDGGVGNDFADDKVVFIHDDLTVTELVWHNESVIFNKVDSDWREFCANSLGFKVPDDLDLIVRKEGND
jgi:hypothetical protein